MKAMSKKGKGNQAIIEWTTSMLQAESEDFAESRLAILIKKFLEKYLYWCMLRYSIAFFQWRRKFKVKPPEEIKTNEDQIESQEKIE